MLAEASEGNFPFKYPALCICLLGEWVMTGSSSTSEGLRRCRYNQAIWASMDPALLSMHLTAFSFNGAPLFGQIEPTPVAVTGNLVGFVMRGDDSMRFGAANLEDLWTNVAEDLAVVRSQHAL